MRFPPVASAAYHHLWLVVSLVRITCKFSYICNTCNFTCITCKEFWLTCKNRDSRQISSFSKKIGEIPTKFHQNLASKWQNSIKKCWKLKISFFIFEKKFDDFLLKFWSLSGAKVCESCRSRQELSNEYLLAKIGVDTAENEPLKVTCKFAICKFSYHVKKIYM